MHSFLLVAGTAGLVRADFAFALYEGGASAALPAAVAVEEVASQVYQVSGLPEQVALPWTLTWTTPTGAGAQTWPTLTAPPAAVVLPLRTVGAAAGLAPVLYRDGTAYAVSLTIAEAANGDAILSGFPVLAGSWDLVVPWLGGSLVTSWPGASTAAAPSAQATRAAEMIARHFDAIGLDWTLRAAGSVTGDRAAGKVARARGDYVVRVIPVEFDAVERSASHLTMKHRRLLVDQRSIDAASLPGLSTEDRILGGGTEYGIDRAAREEVSGAYWDVTARAA